jgi:hypothetical protein
VRNVIIADDEVALVGQRHALAGRRRLQAIGWHKRVCAALSAEGCGLRSGAWQRKKREGVELEERERGGSRACCMSQE